MRKRIERKDLIGNRFDRWMVLSFEGRDRNHNDRWLCRCDCGTEKPVLGFLLRNGESQSCGCKNREAVTRHGHCRKRTDSKQRTTPEYRTWRSMLNRCRNESMRCYARYGGRGIDVCQRWESFDNFIEDMGYKPGEKYSIERIDNDEGYYPENCKWATLEEQARNRKSPQYTKLKVCKPKKNQISKYKGVSWYSRDRLWVANISIPGVRRIQYIGRFQQEDDAARAYNEVAREWLGSKAILNDI